MVSWPARARKAEHGDGEGAEAACSGARSRGAALPQPGRREPEHRWYRGGGRTAGVQQDVASGTAGGSTGLQPVTSPPLPGRGGKGPLLVVAGPKRCSKVSSAAVSSKLARGSQVGFVYPVHFTRTSLREPRPNFRVRARKISSTSNSSSPSSATTAGG